MMTAILTAKNILAGDARVRPVAREPGRRVPRVRIHGHGDRRSGRSAAAGGGRRASRLAWSRRVSRTDSWIRIGLVVAAVAPFVGTLFYGFVYDDSVVVFQNRVLIGWKSVFEVWKHPYWVDGGPETPGLYRPLLTLCFAILANGAHKFAIAYHLFAVALHAAATLLVAKLLRRGVGRWPAAGAALWFALHPVHVEAVASVANVSEVLVCIWAHSARPVALSANRRTERFGRPGWGRSSPRCSTRPPSSRRNRAASRRGWRCSRWPRGEHPGRSP